MQNLPEVTSNPLSSESLSSVTQTEVISHWYDASYLDWPFFAEQHRQLKIDLEHWAQQCLTSVPQLKVLDQHCRSLLAELAKAGFLKYAVAGTQYGGINPEIDTRAICLIRETLARFEGLADFMFAMQGLGSAAISQFGTARQKQDYLPRVADGKAIAAFALSELQAGSDVAALECTAQLVAGQTKHAVDEEGEADYYLLNGEKCWISNAGIADFYVVFARTGEAPGARGISAFIVDADTSGFELIECIDLLAPHPMGRIRFNACKIPCHQRIGQAGQGFKIAMASLDIFRTSVAAAALGFARSAMAQGLARATQRQLFGQQLSNFQLTQSKLAQMAMAIDSAALLTYRAAWQRDVQKNCENHQDQNQRQSLSKVAAMAKLTATENAQQVIDMAVQMFGALGVVSGVVVERLYREIRALRIYEGASEVQLLIIAKAVIAEFQAPA